MQNTKPYRPNVAAIIMAPDYPEVKKFFIALRNDMDNIWQFPQGGIDRGETPKMALLRELEEEIGTDRVEIIAEYPEWIAYDYPENASKKLRPYVGQTQRYFLVRLKKRAKINLATKHAEFLDYRYVELDEMLPMINHLKKPIYTMVIDYFKQEGYL
jgi:putative (di)nucleoside polyphosphate hydrolase